MRKLGIVIVVVFMLLLIIVICDHPLILRSSDYIESATLVYVDTERYLEGASEREVHYELSQNEYESLWNTLRFNSPYYGSVLEYYEVTHYVMFNFENGDMTILHPHGELISVGGYKRGHLNDSYELREAINDLLEIRGK